MAKQVRPKTKISATRVTGTISDWKGTFGWITPDRPINHPEAAFHKGKVYLNQLDVEEEISGIGARVSFFPYTDGTGLGAMNCRPAASLVVVQPVKVPATVPALYGPAAVPRQVPPLRPSPMARTVAPPATAAATGRRLLAGGLHAGQVKTWKGKFGWITPTSSISHPKFKGLIYIAVSDLLSPADQIREGVQVQFGLYEDSQGIGAMSCRVVQTSSVYVPKPKVVASPRPTLVPSTTRMQPAQSGAGANLPRERITEIATTGEVVEWKGNHGWITPHSQISHPEASRRGGRIFVGRKDLVGLQALTPGQLVQFHVFSDSSGLGAEECSAF